MKFSKKKHTIYCTYC